MKSRLEQLAGKDPKRLAILEARRSREKSRTRRITCTACGESGFSDRSVEDICDACLTDLWGARNVLAGEYKAGKAAGMVTMWLPNVWHWIEYPGLETRGSDEELPKGASFNRDEKSSDDILRIIILELFAALSEALPADPTSLDDAERLLPGDSVYYQEHKVLARLPKGAAKALQDLWGFIRWHSCEAHRQGFAAGHDLLSRMNLGDLTHEGFMKEIAEQTGHMRARMQKIAARPRR